MVQSSTVLLEASPALPIVHGTVSTRSGGAADPPGLEGLSRLATRLLRRTAGGRSFTALEEHIDQMGASVGMDCGYSNLAVSGSVLERNFSQFADLLVEMITAPGLQQEELERLRRESVAELLEVLDDDEQLVNRWFSRSVFSEHAYGRSLCGSEQSLGRISVEHVRACLRAHFVRGDLVFGFAGAVNPDDARRLAERLDSALPEGATGQSAALGLGLGAVEEPTMVPGRRLVFVDKPERQQTQILVGGLGAHPMDHDYVELLLANTVLGGTFSGRLSQEVRAKRGWSYGAYSSLSYEYRRQSFSLWTFPAAADAAACLKLKLRLLGDWWERGVSAEELARAKQYLVQSFAFSRDTTSKRVGLQLEQQLLGLPDNFYEDYTRRINSVTLAGANAAIRNRVSLRDLVVTVVGTHSEVGQEVEEAIEDLASCRVVPFDTP